MMIIDDERIYMIINDYVRITVDFCPKRSVIIRKPILDFLWKLMHDLLKIGDHWKRIAGYTQRAECKVCGKNETMEHILWECEIEGREETWEQAKRIWNETTPEKDKWIEPNMAMLRGLHKVKIKGNGKAKYSENDTYRY